MMHFRELKNLYSNHFLALYDSTYETTVSANASSYRLGVVLKHKIGMNQNHLSTFLDT